MIQCARILSVHKTIFWAAPQSPIQGMPPVALQAAFNRRNQEPLGCTVGDWVEYDTQQAEPFPILRLLPRKNVFWRPGPTHRKQKSLAIAANIDQVIGVVAIEQPPLNLGFMYRLYLRAASMGVPLTLLVNKMDLVSEIPGELNYLKNLGYPLICLSIQKGEEFDSLVSRLQGKTSVLVGLSGAGKSTLIQKVFPHIQTLVATVREGIGKGRHTTTCSTLFTLDESTHIIDTPGLKELGIHDLEEPDWETVFPELKSIEGQCRFSDCSHGSEPGCALNALVSNQYMPQNRFLAYTKLLSEWQEGKSGF